MKLMCSGTATERSIVHADDERISTYPTLFRYYDEAFFGSGGLAQLRNIVARRRAGERRQEADPPDVRRQPPRTLGVCASSYL